MKRDSLIFLAILLEQLIEQEESVPVKEQMEDILDEVNEELDE